MEIMPFVGTSVCNVAITLLQAGQPLAAYRIFDI
jgi:hypothetical protein